VNTELAIYFGPSNVRTSVDIVACPATHGEHFWARQLFVPGRVFVALVLAFVANLSLAQSPAAGSSGPAKDAPTGQAGYTLKAHSRIVLTDVTVTDAKGNPVEGLPQSAFHVFDNEVPQSISSFEEHLAPVPASILPVTQSGTYSNAYISHLPSVLNVIVLDITNLDIPDQMWLNHELTQFLNDVTNREPLAIYLRSEDNCFLLQNFTSDRTLLVDALHKAIPRFPPPGRDALNDFDTMRQMAVYLGQIPGRKNVIWFSGGSSLFLLPDADSVAFENNAEWRNLYDELERERIAVYPIDARGLTVTVPPGMNQQHMVMADVARATGGQAFYNTNGMIESVNQVLNTGGRFYTLTYSPKNFQFDNKWHNVRVTLDGENYHLSYRSGYFADGSVGSSEQPPKSRTRLMQDGQKVEVFQPLSSAPILFEANVTAIDDPAVATLPPPSAALPSQPLPPAAKGRTRYLIRYSLPVDALTLQDIDGKKIVTFGIAAIAFNRDGEAIVRDGQRATMTLNQNSLSRHPDGSIRIDKLIDLQRGDDYLYLAVWDVTSHRLGTLQIALNVPKASQ
jgi:VWFA-related protein